MSANESITPAVEYREIDRFEGYRFGDDGSIQSRWGGSGPGVYLSDVWRSLKLVPTSRGYLVVSMKHGRKHKATPVGHLIAEAFIGPRPPGMEVCHCDGNRANNRAANLRYDTRQGNEDDKKIHGTRPRGSRSKCAKITEDDVRRMRQIYGSGRANRISLARYFGLHHSTIADILDRKTWAHVE